jgi:uncharacterized membrane protein
VTARARDGLRLGLGGAGLLVSLYLTLLHYFSAVPLACPGSGGAIDCERVLTSPQAVVLGLPVAAWGLLWFVVAVALAASAFGGPLAGADWLGRARAAWSLVGALVVVYLIYTELLVIGKICLWCSTVHVLVLAMLVVEVVAAADA